jgi:hypothetical protein
MPLVRLPSGEFVRVSEVRLVTRRSAQGAWYVDVYLKNGETIAIACASESDLQDTFNRVGKLIGAS